MSYLIKILLESGTEMKSSKNLLQEIQKRRDRDITYLLLDDEEVKKEILSEIKKTASPKLENKTKEAEDKRTLQLLTRNWGFIYGYHFGLYKDFSNLKIPEKPKGNYDLVIVAEGINLEKIFQVFRKITNAGTEFKNFNAVKSIRNSSTDYAVWISTDDQKVNKSKFKNTADFKEESVTIEEELLLQIYLCKNGAFRTINIACEGSTFKGKTTIIRLEKKTLRYQVKYNNYSSYSEYKTYIKPFISIGSESLLYSLRYKTVTTRLVTS